jgi:O-antigen ligase
VFCQVRILWLAAPVALLFLARIAPPLRKPALVSAAGMTVALVLGSAGADLRLAARQDAAAAPSRGGVVQRMKSAGPAYNRVAAYVTSLNMVAHRPLLGFGFGARTFRDSREGYYASCCGVSWTWAVECDVPHNEILNVLVLTGALGLLAYLGLLQALWRLLWSRCTTVADGSQRGLASAVLAAFVLLAITAQLHDIMYLSAPQVVFFFLAGLATPAAPEPNARTLPPRRGAS